MKLRMKSFGSFKNQNRISIVAKDIAKHAAAKITLAKKATGNSRKLFVNTHIANAMTGGKANHSKNIKEYFRSNCAA